MNCSELQEEYFKQYGQARRDAWDQMSLFCRPYTWVRHKLRRTKRLFQSKTACYKNRTDPFQRITHFNQKSPPQDRKNLIWLTEEQCNYDIQKKKEKEKDRLSVSASTTSKEAMVCIHIKKYGVLGGQGGDKPLNKSIVIVDPAGDAFLWNKPHGAGGASASIYNYLDYPTFPHKVLDGFEPLDAKYHKYNTPEGFVHVIHTVGPYGPDFRGPHFNFFMTNRLTIVYENVFKEFIKSKQDTLRLLGVSSGIYSGGMDITYNTYEALAAALTNLTQHEQETLASKTIEMCLLTQDPNVLRFHKSACAKYKLCAN